MKFRSLLLSCLSLFTVPVSVLAQTQTTELYTQFFGMTGSIGAAKHVIDPVSGDIIIAGYSSGAVGIPGQTTIPSFGSNDWFVARYTSAGTLSWFKTLGSASDDRAYAVRLDSQGSVYVGGASSGDLIPGWTRSGGFDPYVAKYTATGVFVWVKPLVSASFALDRNNDQFVGNLIIDGNDAYVITQEWHRSFIVTKWDKDFTNTTWKQVVTLDSYTVATDVAFDKNKNIIISGSRSSVDIPGVSVDGINVPPAISQGGWDGFVIAFSGSSPTGARTMCANQGSAGQDESQAVTVDVTNNIYVTGYVTGNYDGQPWRNNGGRPDLFLTKYAPITATGQGIRLWSRVLYPAGLTDFGRYMRGARIAIDYVGAVYVVASEQYPQSTGNPQTEIVQASQVYIEKYDVNGNTLGGEMMPPASTVVHTISIDATGTIYMSGILSGLWGSTSLDRGSQVAFLHKRQNTLNCSCSDTASLVTEVMNLAGITVE